MASVPGNDAKRVTDEFSGAVAGFMSPRLSSPMHPSGGGGVVNNAGRGRGMGRGRGGSRVGRDRDLIGQTIKITQGPYKSHVGIVKVNFGEISRYLQI